MSASSRVELYVDQERNDELDFLIVSRTAIFRHWDLTMTDKRTPITPLILCFCIQAFYDIPVYVLKCTKR